MLPSASKIVIARTIEGLPGLSVRRLVAADAADYMAFRINALARDPTAFTSTAAEEKLRPLNWVEERFGGNRNPYGFVLGVFKRSNLVGTAGLRFVEARQARHKATLFGMGVAPELAGRGVGKALVNEILDEARQVGFLKQVVLTFTEGNVPAEALYRRCGFEEFGREPQAVIVDGRPVTKVHMIRFL